MIPVRRAHLHVTANSHAGMKGKNNEDRYAVSAYRLAGADLTPSVLAVIADGIGGHRAGEVAAEVAVESISRFVADSDGTNPPEVLVKAIQQANQVILEQSRGDTARAGMGATCVCAWVIGDRLYAASVGDSRLYLLRDSQIFRLTTDHTWVQEALEHGLMTLEEAHDHPNMHVIRRYLGTYNGVKPDLRLRLDPAESNAQAEANQGLRLLPGDVLVMCSDGLTDLVEDAEILASVQTYGRLNAPDQLIDIANQRGGHDNITVLALEMPMPGPATRQVQQPGLWKQQRVPLALTCAAALLGLVLLAGVAGVAGWRWLQRTDATTTPHASQAATAPALATTLPGSPAPLPSRTPSLPSRTPAPTNPTSQAGPTHTPWPTNTLSP